MRTGFTALVVDDDGFSRTTAVRILKRLGASKVLEAPDGNSALALAEEPGHALDLILCDLRMPQIDGIETLSGLAMLNPRAMFVLVSGADPRLLRAAAASASRAGIASLHVMPKPVTLPKMQEAIAAMTTLHGADPVQPRRARADYGFSAADVLHGLAADEFTVFHQPRVAVADGRFCGAEALIRWQHPEYGLLSPGCFMEVAQANGQLAEIFFVAFPKAVAQCAHWRAKGFDAGVSINLPVSVLTTRNLPNQLEEFVAAHDVPADQVTFEVTEDGWLHGEDLAREVLTRLRLRGFGLAIDDFGTGYSGIQQLLNAPFNELKIDQSFVRAAPTDPEAAIAVRSIVALARQLDLRVVAEGIETQAEWDLVAELGCDEVQGYLISRPLPNEALETWLAALRAKRSAPSVAEILA